MRKENWTYRKVKEVCDKASSNIVLNKIENNVGDYALYGASGFVKGVDFFHREEPYIGIIKDGSGVGRVDVFPAKSSLVGTMQYILPKKDCSLKFLCYALQSLKLSDFVTGAAIPHIYFRDYGECVIPVPPLATQSRIVSELDLLQSIIDKQKSQLKELDNLAQAIFYDMFGDPVENEKGWEVKKLGEYVLVKGRVGWKGYKKEDLRDSGPFAIGGSHITDEGNIDLSSPVFLSREKYEESPEIMVETGDLILVQRGTIGKVGLVRDDIGEATINPCVLILRPISINNTFLLYYLLSRATQIHINSLVRGVAQPMITQQQVNTLLVPVPPLSLQQSFAQKIGAVERQKELINQSIREAQTLFDSRMEYYFEE